MANPSSRQALPLDMSEQNSKRVWKILGVVGLVVVLGVATYFGLGKTLRGSFFTQPEVYNTQVTIDKASLTSDGDLLMTYSITNTGSVDLAKTTKLVAKVYINSNTVETFVKPWNVDGSISLRAGEMATYQMKVPKGMFPKETYGVSDSISHAPPSVGALKTLFITLFGTNDQGQEEKINSTTVLQFQ